MNFLDESGIKKLWTKIKANFGTAIVNNYNYKNETDASGYIRIPFVANHQIINMNLSCNINVYNWFKGASEGGILEIVFAGAQGGSTFGINDTNTSIIYKMEGGSNGPALNKLDYLPTVYNTYARLIKLNGKLVVAEFVQNK